MLARLFAEASLDRRADDLDAYLMRYRELAREQMSTVDRAILAGARADRAGHAFAGGYQSALQALAAEAVGSGIASLCATEASGARPRDIATRLESGALSGKKRWATMSPVADRLLVVASVGTDDAGRNRLRLVAIDARATGVTIAPMPSTPFSPEIPHAEVTLSNVKADASCVLEGDGYDRYLKPFRTIEDIHVFAAIGGYLFAEARSGDWPASFVERILLLLLALEGAATHDPSSPAVHVALAQAVASARPLFDEAGPLFREGEARSRWVRDRPLLLVAEGARAKRTEAARLVLRGLRQEH